MDTQVDNFVLAYPAGSTNQLQLHISQLHEFAQLASFATEQAPKPGKKYKSQEFMLRYLRQYGNIMLLDEAGTGKTCKVVGFTEFAYQEHKKYYKDPSNSNLFDAHYRRAYVVTSASLQQDFRNQISCRCTTNKYLTRRDIDEFYTVATYYTFTHDAHVKYPDTPEGNALMIEELSDSIFWVDEAHYLISDLDKDADDVKDVTWGKDKMLAMMDRIFHTAKRCKIILSTATPMVNKVTSMTKLMNLILPRVMPIDMDYINQTDVYIRQLFPDFPVDTTGKPLSREGWSHQDMAALYRGQIPEDFKWEQATIQMVEPYFRGRIGYIRALDTGATPVYMTNPEYPLVQNVKDQLYVNKMSAHQRRVYDVAPGVRWQHDKRAAANFVYPDGTYGTPDNQESLEAKNLAAQAAATQKQIDTAARTGLGLVPRSERTVSGDAPLENRGFRRYIAHRPGTTEYSATRDFTPYLRDLYPTGNQLSISDMSTKYASIIDNCRSRSGIKFIYSDAYTGSGAITLGVCFEAQGYERLELDRSIFTGATSKLRSLCDTTEEARSVRSDFPKKKRYVLITGPTKLTQRTFTFEALNSRENMFGEYIDTIIVTRVGNVGINIFNVTQIHLIGGEWNEATSYQARYRAIRATGHEDLIKYKRETTGDPNAVVEIEVYLHAAFTELVDGEYSAQDIDIRMYQVMKENNEPIDLVRGFAIQCAINCMVDYERNVRPGEEGYLCFDQIGGAELDPELRNYHNYNILYAEPNVAEFADLLGKEVFNVYTIVPLNVLIRTVHAVPKYRKYSDFELVMALAKLISNKEPIADWSGHTSYLREDQHMYYLDRNYPNNEEMGSYPMSYYASTLVGIKQITLNDYNAQLLRLTTPDRLQELYGLSLDEVVPFLVKQPVEMQINILEFVLTKLIKGDDLGDIDAAVIEEYYPQFIFKMPKPVGDIQAAEQHLVAPITGAGRRPDDMSIPRYKVDFNNLLQMDDSNMVYLHTLASSKIDITKHAVDANIEGAKKEIRIYDPLETSNNEYTGWRTLSGVEEHVYRQLIRHELQQRKTEQAASPMSPLNTPTGLQSPTGEVGTKWIRGFTDNAGNFKIWNKYHEDTEKALRDKRAETTGRTCINYKIGNLVAIMYRLVRQAEIMGLPDPFPDTIAFNQATLDNAEAMITVLNQQHSRARSTWLPDLVNEEPLAEWTMDKLQFFYKQAIVRSLGGQNSDKTYVTLLCEKIHDVMLQYRWMR